MYLISAYFDDATNRNIERFIFKIAEKTGNTFMTENHVPPHITVSSLEARSTGILLPYVSKLESKILCGEIQFVSVGSFFPYVLYMAPVLNEYLQNLSETVYHAISGIADVSVSRYYRPMQWLPHITLGKTLTNEQMREAFAVMQEGFAPFTGKITAIGLAKVNPHEDVWRMELQN